MLSLDTIGLSARFFPPDEAAYVEAAPDARTRADRFAHLWARKEAVVKAAGGRLWPNLRCRLATMRSSGAPSLRACSGWPTSRHHRASGPR